MDYIQKRLYKAINKTKKRQTGRGSTIVGYYNILMQYQLYLMFACIWDKCEPKLSRSERMQYLSTMKRASLGTILNNIIELDAKSGHVLGVGKEFQALALAFIHPRNTETAHGILVPGVQEDSYLQLAQDYEKIHNQISLLNIPILSEECKLYYMPRENNGYQVTVFDSDDFDYQDLNEQVVKVLELEPGELYYYFCNVCYKISPFLILKEIPHREDPYEIYCYQEYNLKNGRFEYKRYSDLDDNISYSAICKDYFLSFQEESEHTISKANGVICNKFENNYDYFISTSPIDTYEQKVWQFIKNGHSNACLTIRGGGGIGKTALVQYVCTKYIFEPFNMGFIQYVIFCSAKDREFTQSSGITGHIRDIKNESIVRCYTDIIKNIGWVIEGDIEIRTKNDIETVEQKLIESSGVLLIIDDFETLSEEDKNQVVALSSRLDVMKHKMIITTRSQYMVGEEYYLEGLDMHQTIAFMKERFHKSCTDNQCQEFEILSTDKNIKKKIFEFTKGLPLLAIQLANLFVLNGIKETTLVKREDEEVEDFLLGRLYSYFGTETSKLLFLIIATFFQYGNKEINHLDLKILYSLLCRRLNIDLEDYEQDLKELKKLNIILIETDFVKISNYISPHIISKCSDEIFDNAEMYAKVFDDCLFKNIIEHGMQRGILTYGKHENVNIDYSFISLFVFKNCLKFAMDARLSILEKYIIKNLGNVGVIRDIYREACTYFELQIIKSQFVSWSKIHGFIIPELLDTREVSICDDEISTGYFLQEITHEFQEQIEAIDDYIERRNSVSQGFSRDLMQNIRGQLGSICNVKLAKVLSRNLNGYLTSLVEIKDLMDEISFTKEFNIKDNEQYKHLEDTIKEYNMQQSNQ